MAQALSRSFPIFGSRGTSVPAFGLWISVFLILIAFVLYPNLEILRQSFFDQGSFSFRNYKTFFDFGYPTSLKALWGSVYISLLSVFFSALVGVPLAWLFSRYEFPGRAFFSAIAVLPILLPPLVGVLAFLFLFGESGILPRVIQAIANLESVPFTMTGVTAILVVHTYTMYVYFYLFASSAFKEMDFSTIEAAKNLGAGRWMIVRKVVLPLLTPALGGASLLVFMTSMASFSAPFIFGGDIRILSTEIYNSKLNGDLELAITQSVVLATMSILFLIAFRWYSNKRRYVGSGKGVKLRPSPVKKGWLRFIIGASGILLVVFLILPHLTVFLISFVKNGTWTWQILPPTYTTENYTNLFQDPQVGEPILNSLKMATMATVGNVIFGVVAAYLVIRKRVTGKRAVEVLTMLPWAIPGTVLAIALIITFNRPSVFTAGQILVGTFWILPLAYFVRNLPLVFRSTFASLEQFDPSLEESARNLGASWWFAFRRVLLPAIGPGIASGALLAFVLAVGEFVSSILLYTYSNRPISVEIISQLRIFNLGSAAAYSVFLIILIGASLAFSHRFLAGRSGRLVI